MTQVYATGNSLRVSPKKAKLLVREIKKLPPQEAIKMLGFVNKKSAPLVKKLIASAIANAKNNNGLDESTLKFKEITIGKGMVFKRYRAVSRGRAHHILKRTSNIRIVLEGEEQKKPAVQEESAAKTGSNPSEIKLESKLEKKENEKKGKK